MVTRTPVVFIHGAWMHALSWESWAERFASRGYLARTPGWPGEPATAREAREHPDALPDTGLAGLAEHYAAIVRSCEAPPVIVGHSVGGLVAQHLLGAGLGQAAVAIAPAPVNEVGPCPGHTGADAGDGAVVLLSRLRFRDAFANTVGPEEAERLYDRYVVPVPRRLLDDLGCGGRPRSPSALVDVGNVARGPLLLVSGQEDLLVPDAATRAAYKAYGDSTATTALKQFADRGHSLVVDAGWRSVADHVLGWLDERGIRPAGPHPAR
ncbi:alpha-beta hydrolase superfamily lysophospholipase [Streptomyces sp. TLI_171]|nr:alpha-beta hydrolase superfamily lysophospholipase [Streptomyces sp. TLI_171]